MVNSLSMSVHVMALAKGRVPSILQANTDSVSQAPFEITHAILVLFTLASSQGL